jgi:2-dehydro-3-deoxygluconokinase
MAEAAMPDIVAIGEPLLEFNQTRRGEPAYLMGHGGDTSNCAVAAARLGASVGYVTRLGKDSFGEAFLDLWHQEGVDASRVVLDPAAPTGIYFVTHGENGHAFTYYRAGSAASLLAPAEIPADYVRGARVLHASGISQAISPPACDAVFEAMAIVHAAGGLVSYDTNLRLRLWSLPRARAVIHEAARQADILLPGLDDARALTGLEQPDAVADFYLRLGASVVALTLGAEGALIATPERRERLLRHEVLAIDATGAGDAFDGAFLAEYLRAGDAFIAGRFANAAAALATTGFGAVAPLPRRDAVEALLSGKGDA